MQLLKMICPKCGRELDEDLQCPNIVMGCKFTAGAAAQIMYKTLAFLIDWRLEWRSLHYGNQKQEKEKINDSEPQNTD